MKKKILVIGGTGAIGAPLVEILKTTDYSVIVTSRRYHQSTDNVEYVSGDAHDVVFLRSILQEHYVAIYDFMIWGMQEFAGVLPYLLDATNQYFYISSCRCFSDSDSICRESTPRWIDIITDSEFLSSNDYSLIKARQEDILRSSKRVNWTIVRPYLTYSEKRLQLSAFEQKDWLLRAVKGQAIVFFDDLANPLTTLTHGN